MMMRGTWLTMTVLMLAGCASTPNSTPGRDSAPDHVPVDPWAVPEPVPKAEPRSRYGNPANYKVFGKRYRVLESAKGYRERGLASWYGSKFHGRRTSSGEPYDMFAITAAHKTLPLPTYVRVRNLENGRTLIVRVNDRGPFHPGRIIDLSYTAAVRLGVYQKGSAKVEVTALTDVPRSVTAATSQPPAAAPAAPPDELDVLIDELRKAPGDPLPERLPFLQIAAFRNMSACVETKDALIQQNLLAISIHESGAICQVLQGPFASDQDAHTQAKALRALGHSPVISYP